MSYGWNNDGRRGGGRGGWNGGGWGRNFNQGGWNGGGGWGAPSAGPDRRFQYDIGQKVIHSATGMELSIIGYGREQLECRKPDMGVVWVYEHEIEPMTNAGGQPPQGGPNP